MALVTGEPSGVEAFVVVEARPGGGMTELKVGDELAEGFRVNVAAPCRLVGGRLSPYFEATLNLPGGGLVSHSATTGEALKRKVAEWVRLQRSRKDGGALKRRPPRISTGIGASRPAPIQRRGTA